MAKGGRKVQKLRSSGSHHGYKPTSPPKPAVGDKTDKPEGGADNPALDAKAPPSNGKAQLGDAAATAAAGGPATAEPTDGVVQVTLAEVKSLLKEARKTLAASMEAHKIADASKASAEEQERELDKERSACEEESARLFQADKDLEARKRQLEEDKAALREQKADQDRREGELAQKRRKLEADKDEFERKSAEVAAKLEQDKKTLDVQWAALARSPAAPGWPALGGSGAPAGGGTGATAPAVQAPAGGRPGGPTTTATSAAIAPPGAKATSAAIAPPGAKATSAALVPPGGEADGGVGGVSGQSGNGRGFPTKGGKRCLECQKTGHFYQSCPIWRARKGLSPL